MELAEASDWRSRVQAATAGDKHAVRALVNHLTPVIQQQAVRALRCRPTRNSAGLRAETEEWVQEVLCLLFQERGRLLTSWDPDRGASLAGFVALIARRHIVRQLSVKRRHGPPLEPQANDSLDSLTELSAGAEAEAVRRDLVLRVLRRLSAQLSPQGVAMFRALYVEDQPVEQIVEATGLSKEAIYKWRSRLKEEVETAVLELSSVPARPSRVLWASQGVAES
jgi:RNA polymerase sigma factor (sigma-70 family)